jgi:uncharacterized protein
MIDRISPTLRPQGRVAQRQQWFDLLFLHWKVPVATLRDLLPRELEVDTFEGDAYVGLVPFTMRGVRPLWAPPVPGISNFHETNVRTYVLREGRDPGVWFFSLDAASRIAVSIARTFWHLPYHHAAMSLEHAPDGIVRYSTFRRSPPPVPAACQVTYRPVGAPAPAKPGTLEHFLAERYILYANTENGGLRIGRVHHPPYPLQRAEVFDWDESLLVASGIPRPDGPPLAHYASGVDVEIFALEPVP